MSLVVSYNGQLLRDNNKIVTFSLNDQLSVHWPLESDILDYSGNGANLEKWSTGLDPTFLNKFLITGTASQFRCTSSIISDTFQHTNKWSVSWWQNSNINTMVEQRPWEISGGNIIVRENTNLNYISFARAGTDSSQTLLNPLNNLLHIVLIYDGAKYITFVNGVKDLTKTLSDITDLSIVNFYLGNTRRSQWGGGGDNPFYGYLKQFRIYSKVIPNVMVDFLYNNGVPV